MLLDDQGLKVGAFDAVTASIFGDIEGEAGAKLLAEALRHQRSRIALRDWLFLLIKAPTTTLHKRFIGKLGQDAEDFVSTVEEFYEDEDEVFGVPPRKVTSQCVDQATLDALARAESLADEARVAHIDESIITLALLETADEDLRKLLVSWVREDGYAAFLKQLRRKLTRSLAVEIFDADGQLLLREFGVSGKRMVKRIVEDASSLGAKKIGARHVLYSLLGDETTTLSRVLAVTEAHVDLHAQLSRELSRPGVKRSELGLDCDCMMDTVVKVLEEARKLAHEREDGRVLEHDLSLAFVARQERELTRLLAGRRGFDILTIKAMLEDAEPELADEEEAPILRLSTAEIEAQIKTRICGQDAAIERVMPWVKRLRFGLPRDGRPAGVFLFLGPTGTGKTQLAKELARYVFGDEEMLIFLEMGQFKTKESMSMFIGAPPGYVGYGEGKLTNGLRDKPESVVLFDEIEKADTQVFDTLLRFADEGMISDPAGPVRDGRKCLIVMTTNAGQGWVRDELQRQPDAGNNPEELTQRLFEAAMKELSAGGFRPEFLGRLDERITFLPFTEAVCREIVDGVLERESRKFRELKDVDIEVDEKARQVLAKFAHRRSMDEGARGAPRAVNDLIVTPAIDLLSDRESEQGLDETKLLATAKGLTHVVLEFR